MKKLTKQEMNVLISAHEATEDNGGDFGFKDEIMLPGDGTDQLTMMGILLRLEELGLIENERCRINDSGAWVNQFELTADGLYQLNPEPSEQDHLDAAARERKAPETDGQTASRIALALAGFQAELAVQATSNKPMAMVREILAVAESALQDRARNVV